MAPTTRTPRQQIFTELERMLMRAKEGLNKELTDRDFDDLDAVLFLVRKTTDALRTYQIRRDLLVQIYAALIKQPIDLGKLDTNWDGQGVLPTVEFSRHLGTIAVAVASRVPADQSPIDDPFEGEKTTCADLRATFVERCMSLGVPHAAQAFVAA